MTDEQHMPDCAALWCSWAYHEFSVCRIHKKDHDRESHPFFPSSCNCELGRLRAENKALRIDLEIATGKLLEMQDYSDLKSRLSLRALPWSEDENRMSRNQNDAPAPSSIKE